MRDKADLHTLLGAGALDGISAPFDRPTVEAIRKQYKIADVSELGTDCLCPSNSRTDPYHSVHVQRQFYRLLEMIFLLHLSPTDEVANRAFRLVVKRRLYLFNKEMLAQLEEQEKKDKLQETFESVVEDYKRITEKFQ